MTTSQNPLCSIVIRAFNEGEHIHRLLDGISQQSVKEVEIILVDSGSKDETVLIAEGFGAKIIRIDPGDFTFGRSLNLGIENSSAEYILIASAHVFPVYPDWIERMLAPFEDESVGLVYGKQRGDERTIFSERQVFAQWYPDSNRPSQNHPFCNNANTAIRRELWQNHNYNESLSGLEDIEWAVWVIQKGYKIEYLPEAEIIHIHRETPRAVFNRYRREAMAYKRIFPQEHFGFIDFLRLTVSNIASDIFHAIKEGILLRNSPSIFWFRFMQFWGTYAGFRQRGPLNWELRKTFYYPRGVKKIQEQSQRDIEPIIYTGEASE